MGGGGARTTVNGTFSTYFTFRITHLITVNGGDFYFTVCVLLLLLEISYIIYVWFFVFNYLFVVCGMEPGSGRGKRNVTITWNNHKHSRSKNMLFLACTTYNRAKSLIHVCASLTLSLSLCTLAVSKALCAFFDFWNDAAFDSDSDLLLLLLLMKMILHPLLWHANKQKQ